MLPDPEWSTGPLCTVPDEGLHETFARAALTHPTATALVDGADTMTYAELDRAADSWAALMVTAGVTPGDLVPVLLPRGTHQVTALLAILKTGAAYTLLEPAWPAPRIHEVIHDLKSPLLVAPARGEVPEQLAVPVWVPPTGPVAVPPEFRPVRTSGRAPACVFFTSGTTGRPKGVVSPHRATARLFQPGGFARFTADTVIPLAAPAPWDAFSLELWGALLNSGTAVLVEEPYLAPGALRDCVSVQGAETVWLTSSLFNMAVDEDPGAFTGLRQVLTGGERLSPAHVRRFLLRHPDIALINGYGPVESTVFATTYRVALADCERPEGIPLGRPVPGTQVYVLDGTRLCPVGEPGEICLAGEGLALRYLKDPALTGSRFDQVWIDGSRTRIYRTGDLGVWGVDGLLSFRGRADRQVKIRGHRVEPAEVERQVERLLPSVRACKVLARADASSAVRDLVAFCVPVAPGDPLAGAVSALRSSLVSYQLPSAVVSVDAFPVTAHGKLDERALLALAPTRPAASAGPSVPGAEADATTALVAEVFGAVLGRDVIPPGVPFVELGGTSLDAGRVCARISARLGRSVRISDFHRRPTVTALADWLRTAPVLSAPEPEEAPAAVPLTPMQVVYLTRQVAYPADLTGHCLLAWTIEGDLDRAALEAAIVQVHLRHEALRATYVLDPQPTALVEDIAPPPLEELPVRPTVEAAVRALRRDLAGGLDLECGEVWRTVLVPIADGRTTVFGCVVHHIAFDGWSESVLADDLTAAYHAARVSAPMTAPAPPSLTAVNREWTLPYVQSDAAARRDALVAELTGVADLVWPADPPERPATGQPGRVIAVLSPAVCAQIDALAARRRVTRFAVLLSRWAASLAEVTGRRDFALGVPVALRDGPGLERAIGCHIDMLCVRMRGAALESGAEAVEETGRIVARFLAAPCVPFGELLMSLDVARTGRPPLYQTLFALQDTPAPRLRLAGARTAFLRQPYLDLPLELHAELWPHNDGGLLLEVSFRPEAVSETVARRLVECFTDRLASVPQGLPS